MNTSVKANNAACWLFCSQDKQNELKNLPLRHQKENADNLAEAEGLLKDLFLDVDKVKRLQHPQANEIESE